MSKNGSNWHLRLALIPVCMLLAIAVPGWAADQAGNATVAAAPQAMLPNGIAPVKSADWRRDAGTFKIGLVRGWSSDMSKPALDAVETVFAKALGTPAKIVVFERFTSLMDAHADGRIDLAPYSARAYASVRLMCECVEPLVTPATLDGSTGQVAVFAGDPSRISTLAAIGPVKIGRVAAANIASSEALRGNLSINGKPVDGKEAFWVDYPDFQSAIKAYQDFATDGLLLPSLTDFESRAEAGRAELLALNNTIDGFNKRQTKIFWRSPFWPFGPIAVRRNLAVEAKTILLKTLEQMDVTEPRSHAVLSDGLPGAFRQTGSEGYANVTNSIRLLVGQNAKWR